jgi:predicted RNase H-like HicB family nuclease
MKVLRPLRASDDTSDDTADDTEVTSFRGGNGSPYHHRMKVKIVLEASDEGGFTAYVPALPGCISEGDDRDEALRNVREAIELYREALEPVLDRL